MRRNCIRGIVIHREQNADIYLLSEKVNSFHVEVVERRLKQLNLSAEQKELVIDKIIENLKLREVDGFIK